MMAPEVTAVVGYLGNVCTTIGTGTVAVVKALLGIA